MTLEDKTIERSLVRPPKANARDFRETTPIVAVVDDDKTFCSILSLFLNHIGYGSVSVFNDGKEIVEAIRAAMIIPDLVLMDYRMPTMNGIAAAGKIQKMCPKARIIMISSDYSVAPIASLLGLKFLMKPFSRNELYEVIQESQLLAQ